MPFRILHLDTGSEMRGGQFQVLRLAEGLAAAGHASTLLARPDSPLLEFARRRGARAFPLRLTRLLRIAPTFDLIHAHDARAHTLAAFLSRPLVVSRRVAFPVRGSLLSRWKYARPVRYIAVSEYVRRLLIAAGVAADRIDVVYDGVSLPPLERLRPRSAVIALNSDDPQKGRSLTQEAAALAGIDVHFTRDLETDLGAAALFVYITESEGLGSAALLAMAAGVPVLASAVGGLPEVVLDGITGFLTSNSSQQIADIMMRMLGDKLLLEHLGRNARARVEEAFTTEHMIQKTLQVYQKVLS